MKRPAVCNVGWFSRLAFLLGRGHGLEVLAGTASGRNSEGEAQADRRQLELEVRRAKPRSDFELVRSVKAFL